MQMRMMALMAVLLAVCLVVLPLLFSNKPFQPTRMEQEQQADAAGAGAADGAG